MEEKRREMTGGGSIQIQAVLYRNDPAQLCRAIQSVDCAARTANDQGWRVSLRWGDASETPLFDPEEWEKLKTLISHVENVEYRFFGENTGYGKGNNLLAKDAAADYLLIMNPEILLPPHALIDLAEPFRTPKVGLTEARQIPVEHPKCFDPDTHETEWASGACFLVPTALFQGLGGFDEDTFFMYCEDVDLSWRIREKGYRLYYQTLVGVYHSRYLTAEGRNQPSKTEQRYSLLSEALLAYKWGYPEYARDRIRLACERRDQAAEEAKAEFERMERMGLLPVFHDPSHRIAHIIQYPESGGLLFTQHRYQL